MLKTNEIAGNGNDTDDENNNYDVEEWNGMALSQFWQKKWQRDV